MVNHSCEHNVSVVFPRTSESPRVGEEPLLQVIAFRDIPAGSELFTTYVDVCAPSFARRGALKETYNFTCTCALCIPSISSVIGAPLPDPRETMYCPSGCGGRCRIPQSGECILCVNLGGRCLIRCSIRFLEQDKVACVKCGAVPDIQETIKLLSVSQYELSNAQKLASTDPQAALDRTRRTLALLRTRLPSTAHPHLDLLAQQSSLLTHLAFDSDSRHNGDGGVSNGELLKELRHVSEELCAAYSVLLPAGHPVRALALTQFGEVLSVNSPTSPPASTPSTGKDDPATLLARSVAVLKQAYTELRLAFGIENGGGRVGRRVRERLVGLEKELDVWREGIKSIRAYG